ncbi:hypothetical protein DFO66_103407 [Brevibacterium sanguinis]|uniref:Uncharacterized protein n=2 Tax=Brevibacterium TaxID=1696 RepID=A0A366IP45_9MICO|nr:MULTISPECIES: hypothetical protein [Brevibacterium]RBP66457.1 hypothetical protein DFO66_103407 [Brevibacterium sanguinis]RBP73109.1 hypothetical protein DFO65_103407 [Brevibacterium celere]
MANLTAIKAQVAAGKCVFTRQNIDSPWMVVGPADIITKGGEVEVTKADGETKMVAIGPALSGVREWENGVRYSAAYPKKNRRAHTHAYGAEGRCYSCGHYNAAEDFVHN